MKVNVVNRKLIKPCTPTPSNLRTHKISLIDELNEPIHVIRILYYPSNTITSTKLVALEESLAKVLPPFYPLAGRYVKEKRLVDCNDEGAEYTQAKVDCDLLQLVGGEFVSDQLNNLLPVDVGAIDEPTDPMLAIQINKFQCGGVAIGVCASYRVFDAASLGFFLQAWASAACSSSTIDSELKIRPDFAFSSFFPPENLPACELATSRVVVKRFVFDKKAISRLKFNFLLGDNQRPPSRNAVVSAFLALALLRADRAKQGKSRASLILQAINVRERTVPPIPKYACGTWVSWAFLANTAEESRSLEYNFPGMVSKMRESTMQGVKDCARIISDKKFGRSVMIDNNLDAAQKSSSGDYKVVWITDWSKFEEYELDFGFGKPTWVSLAGLPVEDLCVLMNNKENDGIEAWVYLHESDMYFFEQDEDLKILTKM